ncbi:hypothetical protein JAAARDRAFT_135850, partial [Jaapia argillacea MUCL 33604]
MCLPGTRVALLDTIETWALQPDSSKSLKWLYGVAGCGKSSIAHSLVQKFQDCGYLAVTFFCSHFDQPRAKPTNVIPTLVWQLAKIHQGFRQAVISYLRQDDSIPTAIQLQFDKLLKVPLSKMTEQPMNRGFVIVIDALDEC